MDIEAVTELNADATVAALLASQNSLTRTELAKVIPTGGGGGTVALPAAIVTSSRQATDGTWPNPIRPAGGGMRWRNLSRWMRPLGVRRRAGRSAGRLGWRDC